MKGILLLFCFFSIAQASTLKAPPNFNLKSKRVVFVDLQTVNSKIVYDYSKLSALARSEMTFVVLEKGYAAFDLIPEASLVELNGVKTSFESVNLPGNTSTVRILGAELSPGTHKLVIENKIEKNISFYSGGVRSAFWMSDLSDRRYLEQYLPVNLEFDQYKIDLEVLVKGKENEHQVRTNGEVVEIAKNHFKISFPSYFTASSFFFHMMPVGAFDEGDFIYKSIDGRDIPVTIYSSSKRNVSRYSDRTKKVLPELEKDYGPFPHNKIVIYGAGSGGMEYCGATITSLSALGHELIHSYFARGVMPARGNSGWVDEAIASWRDSGYQRYETRSLSSSQMAGHSVYRRTTDRNAYSKGARFMGYLDKRFAEAGGLRPFLKKFKEEHLFRPFLTHDFKKDLENHFGEDLTQEFNRYIYGKGSKSVHDRESEENPMHPKMSDEELFKLL